jgi:death-on-curing protein
MAAAYLFHIVKNHPFIDGNKRTGAVSALVFLATNGILVKSDQREFEKLVLNIVDNKVGKDEAANFLRESENLSF